MHQLHAAISFLPLLAQQQQRAAEAAAAAARAAAAAASGANEYSIEAIVVQRDEPVETLHLVRPEGPPLKAGRQLRNSLLFKEKKNKNKRKREDKKEY